MELTDLPLDKLGAIAVAMIAILALCFTFIYLMRKLDWITMNKILKIKFKERK